jgi:NDP-sugar pyrophosphorylase family protein
MYNIRTNELFDLSHTLAEQLLCSFEYPWEALGHIRDFLAELIDRLSPEEYYAPSDDVRISKRARVSEGVTLIGPAVIGAGSEVRTGAFIRGAVLVGEGCVVGNSCELKNSILFDSVQVPHFNYVGDSILGYKAHLGAGAITSNVKCDKTNIAIKTDLECIQTDKRKLGAMVGDFVEVGCNSVLNPGSVIGKNTVVYPLSSVRGVISSNCIFKSDGNVIPKTVTEIK